MVRVDTWVPIDQDSGQCRLVLYRRGLAVVYTEYWRWPPL